MISQRISLWNDSRSRMNYILHSLDKILPAPSAKSVLALVVFMQDQNKRGKSYFQVGVNGVACERLITFVKLRNVSLVKFCLL